MARMFITSQKGPTKLKLGYPVLDYHYDALPFVLDATAPNPVELGTTVMTTAVQGTYVPVADSATVVTADNVNKVIGFILGNNATVPHAFPADKPDKLYPGENGAVVVGGAIAVKFVGATDPAEADKVYMVTASTAEGYKVGDITDGTVVENVTKVQLPVWRFMGITDTDNGVKLTAIHKEY